MITYNHEDYIVEAIESVLKQVTSFSLRLVIGEDGSTDGTREICAAYAKKHPGIVQLLPAGGNRGMMQNFIRTLQACDGKYIAFLEGDDYWTDPYKLQKQIDFLETHPAYSACFHNVTIRNTKNNTTSERVFHTHLTQDTFETEDLLRQWFIPSASFVSVNYPGLVLPDWFPFCKSGDIPLLLLLSLQGKFKYIDEIMGVYRVHDKGLSASAAHLGYEKIISMIYIYENFNVYTGYRYHKKIREAMIYEINHHLPANEELRKRLHEKQNRPLQKIVRKVRNILLPAH
jgi:glycosyltransferase involved in cell wall biosynthesis